MWFKKKKVTEVAVTPITIIYTALAKICKSVSDIQDVLIMLTNRVVKLDDSVEFLIEEAEKNGKQKPRKLANKQVPKRVQK